LTASKKTKVNLRVHDQSSFDVSVVDHLGAPIDIGPDDRGQRFGYRTFGFDEFSRVHPALIVMPPPS
jgi:hypothetical protein